MLKGTSIVRRCHASGRLRRHKYHTGMLPVDIVWNSRINFLEWMPLRMIGSSSSFLSHGRSYAGLEQVSVAELRGIGGWILSRG